MMDWCTQQEVLPEPPPLNCLLLPKALSTSQISLQYTNGSLFNFRVTERFIPSTLCLPEFLGMPTHKLPENEPST